MPSTKNKCLLCGKTDIVCNYERFTKQIQSSFFSVNKKDFSEDFIRNMKVCIICSHKIELAAQMKKNYDERCNRNNKLSPVKCFFCEEKSYLIRMDDNPNGIEDKIDLFLNSVIIRHDYRSLKACYRCIYNLDIWFELRNILYKVMNIPDATPSKAHDMNNTNTVNNRIRRNIISPKSKEITNTTNGKKGSSPPKKEVVANTANRRKGKSRPASRIKTYNKSRRLNWHEYLHEKLKNNITVDKLLENENLTINMGNEICIEDDTDKLFNTLPFVEICLNSQIIKESDVDVCPTIVISDSESDSLNIKNKPQQKKSISLKKTNANTKTNKIRPTPKRKTLRFKMPPLKTRNLFKKKSENLVNSLDNSSQSSESAKEILSSEEELSCNICDKNFTAKCDYLLHELKHEKVENIVINIARHKLPSKINILELTPEKDKKSTEPENISRLLTKWIGENAAKSYYEETRIESENEEERDERKPKAGCKNDVEMETEEQEEMEKKEETETNKEVANNSEECEETEQEEDFGNLLSDDNETQDKDEDEKVEDVSESKKTSKKVTDKVDDMEVDTVIREDQQSDKECENSIEDGPLPDKSTEVDMQDTEDQRKSLGELSKENSDEDKADENVLEESSKENSAEDVQISKQIENEDSEKENKDEVTEKPIKENGNKEIEISEKEETDKENEDEDILEKTIDEKTNDGKKSNKRKNDISKDDNELSTESEDEETKIDNNEKEETSKNKNNGKKSNERIQDKSEDDEVANIESEDEEIENDNNEKDADTNKVNTILNNVSKAVDVDADEFASTGSPCGEVMSRDDLLNILETTMGPDSNTDANNIGKKRKRDSISVDEVTPKRKKVRFAEEKEIFTPDEEGVHIEKVIENDQISIEDEEEQNDDIVEA